MPSKFITIADLARAHAQLIVQCNKCGQTRVVEAHVLNDGRRAPEALVEMEAKTIAEVLPRLKCRGYPYSPCGGRARPEWWVQVNTTGMMTG